MLRARIQPPALQRAQCQTSTHARCSPVCLARRSWSAACSHIHSASAKSTPLRGPQEHVGPLHRSSTNRHVATYAVEAAAEDSSIERISDSSDSSSKPARSKRAVKPAYNNYRSREDIEGSYLKSWQEVTARGEMGQRRITVMSALWYVPLWLKYNVIPMFLRFLFWLVWRRVKAFNHFFHRRAVRQGAKLDAWLAAKGGQAENFSRRVVLERYHYKRSLLQDARYRLALLKGHADEGEADEAPPAVSIHVQDYDPPQASEA